MLSSLRSVSASICRTRASCVFEDLLLESPPGEGLETPLEDAPGEPGAVGQVIDPFVVAGVLADDPERGRDGRVIDRDGVGREPSDDSQGFDQDGVRKASLRRAISRSSKAAAS